ncbi:MAG: hypothetical protein ACP5O6_12000, partial [Candidatus Baltobacteraceae bacterium]
AREHGALFAFDDAIMPGTMTEQYCKLFSERLAIAFPGIIIRKYLYGHDLKQISHNDWVLCHLSRRLLLLYYRNYAKHLRHGQSDRGLPTGCVASDVTYKRVRYPPNDLAPARSVFL